VAVGAEHDEVGGVVSAAACDAVEVMEALRRPALLAPVPVAVLHLLAWQAARDSGATVTAARPSRPAGPKEHCRQQWSTTPSPTGVSSVRLVGAVLAEQHDEWAVTRRSRSVESVAGGASSSSRRTW
jgi:hypothetical protein